LPSAAAVLAGGREDEKPHFLFALRYEETCPPATGAALWDRVELTEKMCAKYDINVRILLVLKSASVNEQPKEEMKQ